MKDKHNLIVDQTVFQQCKKCKTYMLGILKSNKTLNNPPIREMCIDCKK